MKRTTPLFAAAAILAGFGSGNSQVRGTYFCAADDGPWPCLTFKAGGKVEVDLVLETVETTYQVEGRKVKIVLEGVTYVYPIDEQGCIDGGLLFGRACTAGVARATRPPATAAKNPNVDVCALLPKTDVEAIVAVSVPVARPDQRSSVSDRVARCTYGDPHDPPPATVSVQVMDSPEDAARALASGRSDATRAAAVYDVDTVSGLGDDAYWSSEAVCSCGRLYVAVQKYLVQIAVLRMYEQPDVSNKAVARRVAEKLLPKLPGVGVAYKPAPSNPDSVMKADLRNLVTAEEAYFADSTKYTVNLGRLFVPSPGVDPPVIRLTGRGGWTATVRHRVSGRSCTIFVGSTPLPPATEEGEPACR